MIFGSDLDRGPWIHPPSPVSQSVSHLYDFFFIQSPKVIAIHTKDRED